ncbi:hypothetical protein EYR40_009007 [Pleurotus pulmonarius]|nr:hypothetical protein EYR36_009828 [Pleurotus pulmonarius]KAF4594204.1 hypothetical protein EYR40_009007 [Pleurotus pulmonarius]
MPLRGYHIQISLFPASEASLQSTAQEFIPFSLFQTLPAQPPRPTNRRNAVNSYKGKDYRFGPIRIDWVDFETMSMASHLHVGKERERSSSRGPAIATFVPHTNTKSGSTNLPQGVVHVFRDGTPASEDAEIADQASQTDVVLAVLAVPAWMTPSDFLTFVAPAEEGIEHLRIIRDSMPNRSIAILNFRNPDHAADFIEAYNGKPFTSMEPETCNVVRVLSVNIAKDETRFASTHGQSYELPTCPVCLERMDAAVTGLITVPCSHTFHCMCLSKWGDSRCPVCRYSQNLRSSHPTSSSTRTSRSIPFNNPSSPILSTCSSCPSTTNLWICLICGNIGCGRYGQAHAQAHYQETTHLYALELETQRVWDYAGDGYVHRLIQNKADGKLVELPSASASMGASPREGGLGPSAADALSAEKIEAIGIEYSYLLTSQLDSQREYYEERISEVTSQVNQLKPMLESIQKQMEDERRRWQEEQDVRKREEEERMEAVLREKQKADGKADKMAALSRRLEKELREERTVSEGLLKNLSAMKEKVAQANAEREGYGQKIKELEDQVRDVMFFLEARTKIENGAGTVAEAAGGSIALPPPVEAQTPAGKKRKGKKKGS